MQKLNNEEKKFFKNCRELVAHSHSMEMATGYNKNKFNYMAFSMQLQKIVRKLGNEDDFKEIYNT